MPSVLNPVKGNGSDSLDHLEKFSQVVEKKIRNLEKRKVKILTLVDLKKGGKVLDSDQVASVNSLPFVEANLEQLREFLPQFKVITTDYDKAKKKATRREEAKRSDLELKRAKGVLSTLHFLSLLTLELKEKLLAGINGLTLTEDELKTLDGFYTITDTSAARFSELDERLDTATNHVIAFLDRKDKDAWEGTNYTDICDIFEKLHEHHVFDPDYTPPVPPPEEEIPEPEEEEEEIPVAEEEEPEVVSENEVEEPSEPVPEKEEALLNGEVVTPADDGLVNFMHDSQLDRSESQLSPHAPEFQPATSPDIGDDKATFGEFSQDDPEDVVPPIDSLPKQEEPEEEPVIDEGVDKDPAVMAWSAGPPTPPIQAPIQEQQIQLEIQPEPEALNQFIQEPVNPWSKKSTIDWGNSSLPVEDPIAAENTWPLCTPSEQPTIPEQAPTELVSSYPAVVAPSPPQEICNDQPLVEMKDQTTQKLDDDGFTEVADRRRGGNRNRVNNPRGGAIPAERGSYRNNQPRGGSNPRYNNSRGGYPRGGISRGGGDRGARESSSRRGGNPRGGYGDRGGYSARGDRGGQRGGTNYRGGSNYRGTSSRGGVRGGPAGAPGSRPQSAQQSAQQQRTAPVVS